MSKGDETSRLAWVTGWTTVGPGVGAVVALIRHWGSWSDFADDAGAYIAVAMACGLSLGVITLRARPRIRHKFPDAEVARTAARRSLLTRESRYPVEWLDSVRFEMNANESVGLSPDALGALMSASGFRLALCGRLGNGAEASSVGYALRMIDEDDDRIPIFVKGSTFTGGIKDWLQSELEIRYEIDRDAAASVVHLAFPIADVSAAGSRNVDSLFRELADWPPGFLILSAEQEAPSGGQTARVFDLDVSTTYQMAGERAGLDPDAAEAAAQSTGLGPPRNPLEVLIFSDWLRSGGLAAASGSAHSLMGMWVDQVVEATNMPERTGHYLAHFARWLEVNEQSACRPTDILPSTETVSRWTGRILAALALVGAALGLLFGGWSGLLVGTLVGPGLVAHSIHPHSHGQPGDVDTRRGWRTVVKNAADVAMGHLLIGLLIGAFAGTAWAAITLIRSIGPWSPFSPGWIASQVWKPFVFPALLGVVPAVLFFIDGILAFAFWNAFQKVRNARAGVAPMRIGDFLHDASRAGLLERDGANFRFPNGIVEAHFLASSVKSLQPDRVHPGFWYHPQVAKKIGDLPP